FVGLGWVLGVQGAAAVESLGWVSALLLVVALGALAGVVGYRLRRRAPQRVSGRRSSARPR
ncbi:MAG: hypothetical protein HYV93_15495, partial [Candidatus Rokubacteria bacterium]|nr:hypothetical protein [Candidatus Rokubacteria bacterium]